MSIDGMGRDRMNQTAGIPEIKERPAQGLAGHSSEHIDIQAEAAFPLGFLSAVFVYI